MREAWLDDLQRLLLYVAALASAAAWLRGRSPARAVEPALAAGAFVIVAYGLSGRLLPGLIELDRSESAAGRLEQPITYWNAMGLVAAIGLVLCMRMAGDDSRSDRTRSLAAAAAAPLGAGVYLTLSRGALAGLGAAVVVLVLLAATRTQLRATLLALLAAGAAALASGVFAEVRSLQGEPSGAVGEGLVVLVALAGIAIAAAVAQRRVAGAERTGRMRTGGLPLPRRAPVIAVGVLVLALGTVLAASYREGRVAGAPTESVETARLGSVESNRYAYWRVAINAFADQPVRGVGSGAFRQEWLRERELPEPAKDAHSLYIETAAELGLAGLALLALLFCGVAASGRRVHRRDPRLAVGWFAALVAWAVHAGLDWDWEMPAVTLIALAIAGAVIAAAEPEEENAPAAQEVPSPTSRAEPAAAGWQ
jgi:hypothetical protein